MNQRQQLIEQIRQQSIQKRAQALREAAQKQASNAPIAAAAGASSSGGGGQRGCTERDGLTLTWLSGDSDPGDPFKTIYQRVFLPYVGQDESGNAIFSQAAETTSYAISGITTVITAEVYKSGDQWLFALLVDSGGRGVAEVVIAQSPDLYEGWTPVDNIFEISISEITAECGNQTYKRLCITQVGDAATVVVNSIEWFIPAVSEEYPIGYGSINDNDLPIFWDFGESVWTVDGSTIEGSTDLTQPPIGEFEDFGTTTTIVEGQCTGEVPTPPEPTVVTTSDIQVDPTTVWNWFEFTGGGQSSGEIAPLVIDGFQSSISASGDNSGQYGFFTTEEKPNVYNITLTPEAVANVVIDKNSYELVSMILTVTTDGTSPISGGNTGLILDVSGTITYRA